MEIIKRISILILTGFMLLPLMVFAQEGEKTEKKPFSRIEMIKQEKEVQLENLSPRKKYKLGKKLEKIGSNYNALNYYEAYNEKKPEKEKAVFKLAEVNFEMRDYKAAQKWYEQLLEMGADKYPLTNFKYGLTLKHNGEYEKAKEAFSTFKGEYSGNDSEALKKRAEREIEGCDLALAIIPEPDRVLVENAGTEINNPSSDFGPEFLNENDLLFSSFRSDSAVAINQMEAKEKDYKAKLFTSEKKGGAWQEAQLFPEPLNEQEYHFGNPSLSKDGTKLYFTKCNTPKKGTEIDCQIYVSEKKDGKWNTPKLLGESVNAKKSNNTHPAISQTDDGEYVLYFTSNRKDEENGKGGKDIYFATSKNGIDFNSATNAGSTINTEYDDVTPYYDSENNILYFSSNGRVGIGGFDVYKAVGEKKDFSGVEHLGYPINSSLDDLYFRLKGNEKDGLIVSNRPGGQSIKSETCCDDIWEVTIIKEIILKGIVASSEDPQTPLVGADVNFFTVAGEKITPIGNVVSGEKSFLFTMQPEEVYQINVTKAGFHGTEERIDVSQVLVKDTLVKVFLIEKINVDTIRLKRIHFDFNKYNLTRKSRVDLDSVATLLLENGDFTVDVIGHTDSVGTLAYNMRLGKRRAQSTADYLVKKGVEVDRMSIISKGETEPLVPNSNPDGTDNAENRAKNRRVEFILQSNDPDLELKVVYPDDY